jgi:hypothetical protein
VSFQLFSLLIGSCNQSRGCSVSVRCRLKPPTSDRNEQAAAQEESKQQPLEPQHAPQHQNASAPIKRISNVSLTYQPPSAPESVTTPPSPLTPENNSAQPSSSELPYTAQANRSTSIVHTSTLVVTEQLIRALAPSCLIPLTLNLHGSDDETADPQHAKSPDIRAPLQVDIADMLLGSTKVSRSWPADAPLPDELSHYVTSLDISVVTHTTPPADPPPDHQPTSLALLPPGLAHALAPVVLRFNRALDLPDAPATSNALSTQCYRPVIRVRLPRPCSPFLLPSHTHGAWSAPEVAPGPPDPCSPPLRKRTLSFGQAYVIFACDLGGAAFLEALEQQPMLVEIRDRDAKPSKLHLKWPKDDAPPPPPPAEEPPPPEKGSKVPKGDKACLVPLRCVS